MRRRPGRSVNRMDPSGKNANDHGCCRPFATVTTRRRRSSAVSKFTLLLGGDGGSKRIGGGASPSTFSCGANVCLPRCRPVAVRTPTANKPVHFHATCEQFASFTASPQREE